MSYDRWKTRSPDDEPFRGHGYTARDLQRTAETAVRSMRSRFPNKVLTGRMDPFDADAEITKMEIIAEHFAKLAEKEQLL